MIKEEIERLTRIVEAADDMIQVNHSEYDKILKGLGHQNIRSKQVLAVLHLLMKHPILELIHDSRPLGFDDAT
jgi:endonuclease III